MIKDIHPHKFKSVHDFMDALFIGCTPSEEAIIEAKRQYWKSYNTDLIARRRKQKSEFTLILSKEELGKTKSLMCKEKSVTEFLRKIVINSISGAVKPINNNDTALIEQQLFLIASYLEELIDNEVIIDQNIHREISTQLSELQTLINEYNDH